MSKQVGEGEIKPTRTTIWREAEGGEGPAPANADQPKGRRAEEPKKTPRALIGQLAVRKKSVSDWQESREPVSPGSVPRVKRARGRGAAGKLAALRGQGPPRLRTPPGKRRGVAAGRLCTPGSALSRAGGPAPGALRGGGGSPGGGPPAGGARSAARGCRGWGACRPPQAPEGGRPRPCGPRRCHRRGETGSRVGLDHTRALRNGTAGSEPPPPPPPRETEAECQDWGPREGFFLIVRHRLPVL